MKDSVKETAAAVNGGWVNLFFGVRLIFMR